MIINPNKITTNVRDYINNLSTDELKKLLLITSDIKKLEKHISDVKEKEEYSRKQSKNLKEILYNIYPKRE